METMETFDFGPKSEVSVYEHTSKYRIPGETFLDVCNRVSGELGDNEGHRKQFRDVLLHMRFMPAGRIQRAIGSPLSVTPYNCFVSGEIADDSIDIMDKAKEALQTMRFGGGIGYDFSPLRPRGAHIKSLNSTSSGAVSFMGIFDAVCKTIRSAGGRRGAQMGVLRVDHPDIEEFIFAKQNDNNLTAFNISVAVTDEFMEAVKGGNSFDLRHDGRVYKTVSAKYLWNELMRSTWDWAEPGVLFIDRINQMNNLWYCETISATNPCAEQPLPPYGACLLGSFNLTQYIVDTPSGREFNYDLFRRDIPVVVRAMDNVVDRAIYPLPQQETEAKNKRRMGLGITGTANAIESLGFSYGSDGYLAEQGMILKTLRDEAYRASARLAEEKGKFPLFDQYYFQGRFIQSLPDDVIEEISKYGIRNSHLLSIAPTGTISLAADNVSSGIEPVFAYKTRRTIINEDGVSTREVEVEDYGYRYFGTAGRTVDDLSVADHIRVLTEAQKYVDSAISKTCNVGNGVTFEEFKDVYWKAYEGGAKGCTTFRAAGKRFGILNAVKEGEEMACYINPETGEKSCG